MPRPTAHTETKTQRGEDPLAFLKIPHVKLKLSILGIRQLEDEVQPLENVGTCVYT